MPSDFPALYEIALHPRTGLQLRYGGATPSYQDFTARAYDSVLVQHVAEHHRSSGVAGLFVLSTVDFSNGIGHFSVMMHHDYLGTGLGVVAGLLFLNYCFAVWDLRKIVAEVADYNLLSFRRLVGRLLELEGVRRRHVFWMGDYVDVHQFAIWRGAVEDLVPVLVAPFLGGEES